jgi:hypothetical protein
MDADAAGLAYPSVRADKWETRAVLADRRHLPLDQARLRPHLRDRAELVRSQAQVFETEYVRAGSKGVDTTAPRARARYMNAWLRGFLSGGPRSTPHPEMRAILHRHRRD